MDKNKTTISAEDRLCDFLDENGQPKFGSMKEIVSDFREKIREIQSICDKKQLSIEELAIMIGKNFGYWWNTIPWYKMEEIRIWSINNWFRYYQLLNSYGHNELMKTDNEYSKWFRNQEERIKIEKEIF